MKNGVASSGVVGSAALCGRHMATSPNPVFDVEKFKARRIPPQYEALHPSPSTLLNWSLSESLQKMAPQDRLSQQVANYERNRVRRLPSAHHLLYFHPGISDKDLMDDGTDMLHAPDGSWKYRLWAGGTMEWPSGNPLRMNGGMYMLTERIADLKLKEDDGKAFVKVERRVHHVSPDMAVRLRQREPDPDLEGRQLLSGVPDVLETRWLCFTRKSPFGDGSVTKVIEPPAGSYFDCTMTATQSLLFRFSALTFNAHKIHIDPDFARNVYGLPNIVVHGPLTIILMTTVLRAALCKRRDSHGLAALNRAGAWPDIVTELVRLEYKNMAPVYAGEEITIACKPLEPTLNIDEVQKAGNSEYPPETWQIWIEKMIDGKRTVAATCTATMRSGQPKERERRAVYRAVLGRREGKHQRQTGNTDRA